MRRRNITILLAVGIILFGCSSSKVISYKRGKVTPDDISFFLRNDLKNGIVLQRSDWENGNHVVFQIGYHKGLHSILVKSIKYFYYNSEYGLDSINAQEKVLEYNLDSLFSIQQRIERLPSQDQVNRSIYDKIPNGQQLYPISGYDYYFFTKENKTQQLKYLKACNYFEFFMDEFGIKVKEYSELFKIINRIGKDFKLDELRVNCDNE